MLRRTIFVTHRSSSGSYGNKASRAAAPTASMNIGIALRTLNILKPSGTVGSPTAIHLPQIPSVTKSDVRKAYLRRILECHPDTKGPCAVTGVLQEEGQPQQRRHDERSNAEFHRICEAYTFLNNRIGYTADGQLCVRPAVASKEQQQHQQQQRSPHGTPLVMTSFELAEELTNIACGAPTHADVISCPGSVAAAFERAVQMAAEESEALDGIRALKASLPQMLCGARSFEVFFNMGSCRRSSSYHGRTKWMLDAIRGFDAHSKLVIGKLLKLRKQHNTHALKNNDDGAIVSPKRCGLSPLVLLGALVFYDSSNNKIISLSAEAKQHMLRNCTEPKIRCAHDLCCFLPYDSTATATVKDKKRGCGFMMRSVVRSPLTAICDDDGASLPRLVLDAWARELFAWERASARRLYVEQQITRVANELSVVLGLVPSHFSQAAKRAAARAKRDSPTGTPNSSSSSGSNNNTNNNANGSSKRMKLTLWPNPALETRVSEHALLTMRGHLDECITGAAVAAVQGECAAECSPSRVAYHVSHIESILAACSGDDVLSADPNLSRADRVTQLRRMCKIDTPPRNGNEGTAREEVYQQQQQQQQLFDLCDHVHSIRVDYSTKSALLMHADEEVRCGGGAPADGTDNKELGRRNATAETASTEEHHFTTEETALDHRISSAKEDAAARSLVAVQRNDGVCCAEDMLYDIRVELHKDTALFVRAIALALQDVATRVYKAHRLLPEIQRRRTIVEQDLKLRLFVRLHSFEPEHELAFWRQLSLKENAELVAAAQGSVAAGINVHFHEPSEEPSENDASGAGIGNYASGGGWVSEEADGCDKAVITPLDLEIVETGQREEVHVSQNFRYWLSDVLSLSSISRRASELLFEYNLTDTVVRSPHLVPHCYLSFLSKLVDSPVVVSMLKSRGGKDHAAQGQETKLMVSDKFAIERVEGRLEIPWYLDPNALIDVLHNGDDDDDEVHPLEHGEEVLVGRLT